MTMNRSWKRTFIAILIAEGFAIAGFATSMPIIPFYLQELGATTVGEVNFWNGLIQGGGSLTMAIFAPLWGALADVYGRKKMLLRAMTAGAVVLGLISFASAPWQVFVLRIIQGSLTGTIAAATVLVSSIVPEKKVGFSLGLLQTSVFVGASVGPFFGGIISDLFGHRVNFIATSFLLFSAAAIVLILVEENFTPKKNSKGLFRNAIPDFRLLRTLPGVLSLFLMIFSVRFAGSIVNPIMPLYIQWLTPGLGLLGTITGVILSISAGASAVSAALIGKLSDRFGYSAMLGVCVAGSVLFFIPQGMVHSWQELLVLRIFDGIFLGGTLPVLNAIMARKVPAEKRGTVFGMGSSFSSAGFAAGPAVGAFTAASFGYPPVFFLTSALLACAGVLLFKRSKREKENSAG